MLTVWEESPRQEAVASLLLRSDAFAAFLYPNAHRRALNPETLDAPGIFLFVARDEDGAAAGCCALFDLGDGAAELKRMFVDPNFRRQGVGHALLLAAETAAVAKGFEWILMEVGIRNIDGQELYRRAGYRERGHFGAHKPSPISLFLEKSLGDSANP